MNSSPCSNPDCRPVLTIDLKKNRLRIYKQTLHLLDDPEYIQFLVNPAKRILAVKPSTEDEKSALKISWTVLKDRNQCCEFYSKYFVSRLEGLLSMHEDMWNTHKVTGKINLKKNRIFFDLGNSEMINDEIEALSETDAEG